MPYTKLTAQNLQENFGVSFDSKTLFDVDSIKQVAPSAWLLETIAISNKLGFNSEKSRSERIVSPILVDLNISNNSNFTIYSGLFFNIDEQRGLNGECDFLLSYSKLPDFIDAPVFCVTEAKRQNIEQGSIQCAAQLVAAKIFNEKSHYDFPILYGCSTSGTEWRFLTLENNLVTFDKNRYFINDLPLLLGVLQTIIDRTNLQNIKLEAV